MAMKKTPLQKAIEAVGGQRALARVCGVEQANVWYWLHRAKKAPAEHVITIEEASGVSRHDLRPDIYPRAE